jgi:2,5-diketo-D-gluconate reductase B
MPKLGLGTFRMTGAECAEAVERAVRLGYRHIDTAQMYGNEDAVGEGLAAAGVARGEVHVTTKVWWENLRPDAMRRAMEASLTKLRTDYVDLYLIHWPAPDMNLAEALTTLVSLQEAGLARRIGVSNFPVALMREAVQVIGAPIICNQVEFHVKLSQAAVLGYAHAHGLAITSYCPLGRGGLAEEPALAAIAAKHGVSAAQVALKWLLDQDDVAAIPKAQRESSQRANLAAMSVVLDDADRQAIAALPKGQRLVNPPFAPKWDG